MDSPRDAVAAVVHPDPYPWYAALRRATPLYFDQALSLWVASSASVVKEALHHPHLRVRPPAEPVPRVLAGTAVGEVFAQLVRMNDGAFHAEHKPRVERAARAMRLDAVAQAAHAAAQDLAGRVDANAWLSAVPVQAMVRVLGVPATEHDATVAHVQAFTQGISPGAGTAAVARADAAARALLARGTALGFAPVAATNRIAFMQQALDATAGLIGNALLHLRRAPRVPDAAWLDAVARQDPAIHNTRRYAAQDTRLAGQVLRAGEGVLLVLASAAQDDPSGPNLTFGGGAHACPGERIACTMALAALAYVHTRADQPSRFQQHAGYRPLPNARIPVFTH